ncbi:DMT family transporter [Pleionea sediminis]|uniref:DMT family transporter n=1 Tax=Pleionea sediminis TaxID=2569479 RepID=UPI001186B17B|nr:DMT family transporter [Pleionea sediminis]
MQVRLSAIIYALLAILLMSFVPALIKINAANEVEIAFVRLAVAGTGVYIFLKIKRLSLNLNLNQWLALGLLGGVFAVHWFLYFKSIKLSTPSVGAITVSTYGIHVALLSRWLLKQSMTRYDIVALVLAGFGLYILIPEFNWHSDYFLGAVLGIASGFLYACLPIIHQKNLDIDATVRTAGQFIFACICFGPFAIPQNWSLSVNDWQGLIFLGIVSTLLAHSFWIKATSELPGVISGVVYYLYIPAAMLMSVLLAEEKITGSLVTGALIIIVSNVLLVVSKWKHSKTIKKA